ncbi:peroxiredoxin family protein [Humisphaera borealis]|uniref:Redoxin domain-containing protein n=1 Tax=Humisphaera borealis TaxID=2807512 RepID=A0A7M2WPI1_9BACT|nr:peroxiredoxin family protein [Humisphaera borealis]QOV87437.1 redoxin domain-containing protein [Humisphaera borealis]
MKLLRYNKHRVACLALAAAAGLAVFTASGRAQQQPADPTTEVRPGHSVHGDTFDEGPRRAAPLMVGTGDVHFPVTTRSEEAQKFFDQGVGQLHGFWYLEAERSFRHAASIDPTSPMTYWGMAMANYKNPKRAKVFIDEASHRMTQVKVQPIEEAWIKAVASMYVPDIKPDQNRKKKFVETLGKMRESFKDDIELKAFSVFFIWEYKTGDKNTAQLLDEVFAVNPRHPAHHYRIHLLDGGKAKDALASAAINGPAAAGIAHMWHMPGHIYSSLQRYGDAAWQQEASARVDHAYMIRDRVMPYEIHNYAHNNEWLIRDLMFVGRVSDGIDLAKNMVELPRHPKYGASSNRGTGAEYGYQRLIDALSLHQMWDDYLDACGSGYLPANEGDNDHQIRRLRFKGVAHAALGQVKEAQSVIAELKQMKAKAAPAPAAAPATRPAAVVSSTPATPPASPKPATKPAGATPAPQQAVANSGDQRPPAMIKALAAAKAATQPAVASATKPATAPAVAGRPGRGAPASGPGASFDRAIEHIEGQLALTAKDYPKAIKLLTSANIRQEHLSLVHLAAGDNAKAIDLAKKAADSAKGQTYPLANYVKVLFNTGKKDEAKAQLEKLNELAFFVDLKVEPYKSIGPIAKAFGVTKDDWRPEYKPAKDLGERPPLDQLGPFRWHPSPAPAFSAPAADGAAINLESYKGKPVVVIFYLGYGCLHCTQQLAAFAPLAKQYAEAGISLVAISTDDRESLHKAWEGAKLQDAGQFPFPLAADPKMDIFKRYNCYDDFEKSPIHGTFLIDGKGLIRWQDISAEPFMDGAFLLKEARRLLAAG